ncbi:hypothetical protein BJX76DRAFT_204093 [Aspergillus varians]
MAQDPNKPSGATLGYLAPICVAVFFVLVCFRRRIIVGTRQRFRAHNRRFDPEAWPLGVPYSVLPSADLDSQFPSIKYSAWSTAHQANTSKEVQVDPNTSQAPNSPSAQSFDAAEKEISAGRKAAENDMASTHSNPHMECAICMEDFGGDDSIRALTCGHIFHAACLDPWFTKWQARCPLCKTCYNPGSSSSAPTRPPPALIRNQIFPRVL